MLIVALIFVGMRSGSPEPAPTKPRPKKRLAAKDSVAADDAHASSSTWMPSVPPLPLDPATDARTARAMDDAGLRYQIARLRIAASAGECQVAESIQAALRRYGADASKALEDEITRETNPAVRDALIGAAKGLR